MWETSHGQSADKSKSVVAQEQITFSDKPRSKSTMEKILLFLVVFFFIATVVFIAFFVLYYIKYEHTESNISSLENNISDLESNISRLKSSISTLENSVSSSENSVSSSENNVSSSENSVSNSENNVSSSENSVSSSENNVSSSENNVPNSESSICNSRDCLQSASMMINKMNPNVDPCQDFYEYSCGQFIDDLAKEGGDFSVLNLLELQNQQILASIIEAEAKPDDPQYLINMKKFHKSCMDVDQIEAVGLAPYLTDTEWVNDWPTLNSAWDPASFNLIDLIVRYERVYIEPLYLITVFRHMVDPTKNSLYVGDGSRGLPTEYYKRPRNDSILMAYETYLTEVAVALGANRSVAEKDSKDVVDLEKALSEINRGTNAQSYKPTTLIQLDAEYPELGIARAVRAAFGTSNMTLPDDQFVYNSYSTYLDNLLPVLSRFENRTIQNMYGSAYARSKVVILTREMRKINLKFNKAINGITTENRRATCQFQAVTYFWKGMAKQFVAQAFSEDAKTHVNQMTDYLKSEFMTMLEENPWMSESAKNVAYVKLTKLKLKIGYPDQNFSEQDIEDYFSDYTMTSDHYYNNRKLLKRLEYRRTHMKLMKPVDKSEWRQMPYDVNAFIDVATNELVFPAGILQPPFFSQTFQDAMNYGAIGTIIGHEITHGFYGKGLSYDSDGKARYWWTRKDIEGFVASATCVLDQFSDFHLDEINMNLRGDKVLVESVADLGGIKKSFRAYKQLVKEKGEQPTLPGLGLTPDQVFFLAYSQLLCEKVTPEYLYRNVVFGGNYPPGKYRVIGTLQNTKAFAQAFKCPVGSYMNPRTKCSVW